MLLYSFVATSTCLSFWHLNVINTIPKTSKVFCACSCYQIFTCAFNVQKSNIFDAYDQVKTTKLAIVKRLAPNQVCNIRIVRIQTFFILTILTTEYFIVFRFSLLIIDKAILRSSLAQVGESDKKSSSFSSNPLATNLDLALLFPLKTFVVDAQQTDTQFCPLNLTV